LPIVAALVNFEMIRDIAFINASAGDLLSRGLARNKPHNIWTIEGITF
jgi:hypothetical protein